MENANTSNNETYHEVIESGVGALYCLGCEVYGRWGAPCVELVPKLAREHTRGLHPRVRRGAALAYQSRWWAILGCALQKAVAMAALRDVGEDLPTLGLAPFPPLADLVMVQ